MIFKVYGERNSGTTFLTKLLRTNFENIQTLDNIYITPKEVYSWKHSPPNNHLKQNKKDVVDFIIFRELNDWLISMFKNPYHLCFDCPEKDFEKFLTKKQKAETIKNSKWIDVESKEPLNIYDDNKTIFEIRYFKYLKTMKYFKENKNVVLINLSYLQNNDNCEIFINEIQKKYNLPVIGSQLILKHTKYNTFEKNRKYDIDIEKYDKIIQEKKHERIEKEINNLNFIIKT